MTIDASMFDFDNMVKATGADPFAAPTRKWEVDERFYKLPKDEDGNGAAVIRFLPDAEKGLIQQIYKINSNITKDGKRRFVNEMSPQTIGAPCPFQEEWARLWNEGSKEEAKTFSRTTRYYTNIKVLKDPREPENEGKIFLLDMSGTLKDRIQALLSPSETDLALGATPKQLFNPLMGHSYKLVSRKGSNNIINYDSSSIVETADSIYESAEEALKDIKENTHRLSQFLEPDAYLSYDELKQKLDWLVGNAAQDKQTVSSASLVDSAESVNNVQAAAQQPEVQAAPPAQAPAQQVQEQPATDVRSDSLDDLLAGLVG